MQLNHEEKDFIRQNIGADASQLMLQSKKYPDLDMKMLVNQIVCRQKLKDKLPSWFNNDDLIFSSPLSSEQCSSEQAAAYKASLFEGKTFADLTGGLGVDSCFLSKHFEKGYYVELSEELAQTSLQNFDALNVQNLEVKNSSAEDFLAEISTPLDIIYLDPDRRDEANRKLVAFEDCSPDLLGIKTDLLSKAKTVVVKASPMLDIKASLRQLPETIALYVIAIKNECKELLFCMKEGFEGEAEIRCVNLIGDKEEIFTFDYLKEQENPITFTSELKQYLYEPNTAILKGGGYRSVAMKFGLEKLHPNSHLYTSDQFIEDFQGRSFKIESHFALNKKEIKKQLKDKKASITVRNFPMSVADIRKKTGLSEGGDYYLFATTLNDEKKTLIKCSRV
ncbi:class I SAM-dependent methyltransferase [Sediminitomix flava]|uniref:Putative methyltransferase n=1 Tax=Sediminitomix flava TaxID=379075 RepID=A0A315Z7M4_SEDFL|nr:class I SAM-dependent methyltransferase [Sediminitomix flava]PWJ40857.1 putative methyltransferase [Sediminitomix flava]